MAFFEKAMDITKKFGEVAQSAAKTAMQTAKEKSEMAIEIGKLKKDILVENGKLNRLYDDIGRNAYDIYCGNGEYAVLEPLFLQVSDSLSKIEETKEKIEEVKACYGEEAEEEEEAELEAETEAPEMIEKQETEDKTIE
jgi:hypothetical protein